MEEEILKGKTLLIVDDESDLRDIVASELEFMGAKVFQAENISAAQRILNQNKVDLVVSDIRMPGGTGIDLLDFIKSKDEDAAPVILITGFADITIEDAFHKGAEALLNKPFKLDDLIKLVVRYTSPFFDRFSEYTSASKSIKGIIEDTNSSLGRGGAAVKVRLEGRKVDIGESVNFEIEYDHEQYRGQGICRWIKLLETEPGTSLIGLEFTSLSKDSLLAFSNNFQGKKVIPFIPSFQSLIQ